MDNDKLLPLQFYITYTLGWVYFFHQNGSFIILKVISDLPICLLNLRQIDIPDNLIDCQTDHMTYYFRSVNKQWEFVPLKKKG